MHEEKVERFPRGRLHSMLFIATCSSIVLLLQFGLYPNSTLETNSHPTLKIRVTGNKTKAVDNEKLHPGEVIQVSLKSSSELKVLRSNPKFSQIYQPEVEARAHINCDRSHSLYDICSVNSPIILDPKNSTFYIMDSTKSSNPIVQKIKPYPRKFEAYITSKIQEITITSGPPSPQCQVHHNVPALVFSAGGYTGNFFHEFNEGFIPLFVTVNTIYPNQDFIIVVTEAPDWWLLRYSELLKVFTKHPIITTQNDKAIHCFPSATMGLMAHDSMTINHRLLPNSKTFMHFRGLLDKAFQQNFTFSFNRATPKPRRPRLVFVSRRGNVGRVIVNQDAVIKMMKEIGFNVVVFEPTDTTWLCESYALINASHAMVGVHGAGLTHSLFLRPGSVFVQVVPVGIDWAADTYFGRVGRGLNLEYIEYKIGVEESSLVDVYGKDNMLLKHQSTLPVGWPTEIMDIYLRKQNVKIDLVRFRGYMKKAYVKAKKFMRKSRLKKMQVF